MGVCRVNISLTTRMVYQMTSINEELKQLMG